MDPIWLVKAIAGVILAAFLCAYASLCLLLYQGQWQLILHPKLTIAHPADLAGTPIEFLRFGPDDSGLPQRTAWIVPAAPGARYASLTILFLPSGDGSLAEALPSLTLLHNLGVNLFALDYRGYGESVSVHPNQARMTEDAASAFEYLTRSRNVPPGQVIPYGVGLGASLAVRLASDNHAIASLILDSPAPDPLATVRADPRTKYLPVRLLLHDRFPLAVPLATLKTSKLLVSSASSNPAFEQASDPRLTVHLPAPRSDSLYMESVTRFLDEYGTGTLQRPQF